MPRMTIPELLDAAKAKQQVDSDNRLALALVVSRGVVSQWRNGVRAPDAQAAMKLADMAGLDRLEVLAICELQRETDPKRRQYWATFLPGLRRVAALVIAGVAALFMSLQDVSASTLRASDQYSLNINSRTFGHELYALFASVACRIGMAFLLRFGLYQGLCPRYPHRA